MAILGKDSKKHPAASRFLHTFMRNSTTVEPRSQPQSAAGPRRRDNSGSLLYDMCVVLSFKTGSTHV